MLLKFQGGLHSVLLLEMGLVVCGVLVQHGLCVEWAHVGWRLECLWANLSNQLWICSSVRATGHGAALDIHLLIGGLVEDGRNWNNTQQSFWLSSPSRKRNKDDISGRAPTHAHINTHALMHTQAHIHRCMIPFSSCQDEKGSTHFTQPLRFTNTLPDLSLFSLCLFSKSLEILGFLLNVCVGGKPRWCLRGST